MIKIYTTTLNGSSSCKNAIRWLEEQQIPYQEIKVNKTPLKPADFYQFLPFTKNGLNSLMTQTAVKNGRLQEIPLSEAIYYLTKHPNYVRMPILFDGKKLKIGFRPNEIGSFIPKEQRQKAIRVVYKENIDKHQQTKEDHINELFNYRRTVANDYSAGDKPV